MSAHLIEWLAGSFLTVLLLAGITVGTWAALRVGRTTQVIKNFRDEAESSTALAEALRNELMQVKSQLNEALARIAIQDGKMAVLQELVTGSNAIAELRREVLEEFRLTRDMIKAVQS